MTQPNGGNFKRGSGSARSGGDPREAEDGERGARDGRRRMTLEEAWEIGFAEGGEGEARAPGTDGSASAPIPNTGRRSAPRLRLSLPARLITIDGNQPCILLNLSRSGAQVALFEALRTGESAVLRCASIDVFGDIVRCEIGLNALRFETELRDENVLAIRRYADSYAENERRSLVETARNWVTGESGDDRAL